MNAINRRTFLGLTAGTIGLVSLETLLTGCGTSGSGYSSGYGSGSSSAPPAVQGGNCTQKGVQADVQVLHTPNHTVTVPSEDVAAGVEKTYLLTDNGSHHTHQVTVTAQDFAMLRQGQGVQKVSTGGSHTHVVTLNCLV